MSNAEKIKECPRCAVRDFGREPRADGLKHVILVPRPTPETFIQWSFDGIGEATDGCRVEPDGRCPHGHTSWLRVAGIM